MAPWHACDYGISADRAGEIDSAPGAERSVQLLGRNLTCRHGALLQVQAIFTCDRDFRRCSGLLFVQPRDMMQATA